MTSPTTHARAPEPALYHWAEWPLAAVAALLLAAALWWEPGDLRGAIIAAFKVAILAMAGWSLYREWRMGGLSRSIPGTYQGMRNGEATALWMHRRTPLRLSWLALMVLGSWHF